MKDLRTISKRLLLTAVVTLAAHPGNAQTVGWAHQRLSLHLSDAAIVFLEPPRRPKTTKEQTRDATRETRGTGKDIADSPAPISTDMMKVRNNVHVQSAKSFYISVISQQRRYLPESYVLRSHIIYLTDIVYTASQQ